MPIRLLRVRRLLCDTRLYRVRFLVPIRFHRRRRLRLIIIGLIVVTTQTLRPVGLRCRARSDCLFLKISKTVGVLIVPARRCLRLSRLRRRPIICARERAEILVVPVRYGRGRRRLIAHRPIVTSTTNRVPKGARRCRRIRRLIILSFKIVVGNRVVIPIGLGRGRRYLRVFTAALLLVVNASLIPITLGRYGRRL